MRALIGKTSASGRSSTSVRTSDLTVLAWFMRSTLLTAITIGIFAWPSASAMKRSPAPPMPWSPLTTNSAASASLSSDSTRFCMREVSASRGRWTPGRSVSTSWNSGVVSTPRIARRVVCGLSETIATLWPIIVLTSVDLPTFGRPASATNPDRLIAAIP